MAASALTNLAEGDSTHSKNEKDNKEINNKEAKNKRLSANSSQIQNGSVQPNIYTPDSRSQSQTELSFGDENHQNVSNNLIYLKVMDDGLGSSSSLSKENETVRIDSAKKNFHEVYQVLTQVRRERGGINQVIFDEIWDTTRNTTSMTNDRVVFS